MEGVLLAALGGHKKPRRSSRARRLPMDLRDLDHRTLWLQASSIEESTVKGYTTGARDYLHFCMSHSLSIDPTPQTLSRYISYTSRFIASGPKYLTGVRHFLRTFYPDFDVNRSNPLVTSVIRGSKKIRADPISQKLPLHLHHLSSFLSRAQSSQSYDDLLFITILACAFYGCHRIGELVQRNDKSLFNWRKVIKRSSLILSDGRAQYRLPYHKSDPFYHGTDVLFTPQDIADPVALLSNYVLIRDRLHGAAASLFLRENGSYPTRSWFDSKFFSLLDRSFGGHSARAGGATYYASLGLSEDIIQALGRWSSKAWKIYIRDNPIIRAELQLAAIRLLHR